MNMSIRATTMAKMAGVWQTAEPMSMLVVSRPLTAGWRDIPQQACPPGSPEPTPDPRIAYVDIAPRERIDAPDWPV